MEFFAVHSDSLRHRCILPMQCLNHILAEGHSDSMENGLLFKITECDTKKVVFLGMTEFSDEIVELPHAYLPGASHVAVEVITTDAAIYADRMIIQAETDDFAHEMGLPGRDVESVLIDYIQREVPAINKNAVFEIHGETAIHRLHVISLWKDETEVPFTYAINHNITVEFIPSMQAERELERELERTRVHVLPCSCSDVESLIPIRAPEYKWGPAQVLGGNTIATTREERAAAFRKKLGMPPK